MDRTTQLDIYRAQTENVRELEKAWTHAQRLINRDLINDNSTAATHHSKLLALIFCAWSEANFQKLIHTPHGFELDEILQIKLSAKHDIVQGWQKCLEIGLQRISAKPKSNYLPNIKQTVERIIHTYVHEPRLLRNKIAHGQWNIALNRDNDAINGQLTAEIAAIDIVKLAIWKEAYKSLSLIIEALIESPDKAFHRDYWQETVKIEEHLRNTEKWSLRDKIQKLKVKASHYKKVE
jgi:hypothetical protein